MTQLIIYLVIAAVSLKNIKLKKRLSAQEWFEKKNTDQLRGMCALLIVTHHIASQNFSNGFFHQIGYISILSGYLLVGYFFLISGYGMEYGEIYSAKKKTHTFLRRVITIGVPYITTSLLYMLFSLFTSKYTGVGDIVASIAEGDPVVKYSWYAVAIIIIYAFFEISKINASHSCNLYMMAVFLAGYIGFGIAYNYSEFWYNTVLIVLVGIYVARNREKIYAWISCHYKYTTIMCLVVLGAGVVFQIKCGNYFEGRLTIINVLIRQITLFSFVCLTMITDFLFQFNSTFLKWVATFSYEIYLSHGFVMIFMNHFSWFDTASIAYAMSVVIGTILLSYAEHLLNKRMISAINQLIFEK